QLVVREIERNMQRAIAAGVTAPAVAAAAAVPAGIPASYGAPLPPLPYAPPPATVEPVNPADEHGVTDAAAAGDRGNGSLASVAKAAAMKAERAAIEHTLRQVQWNRRKAAQILGVSYKTLLNKIKECGISRA